MSRRSDVVIGLALLAVWAGFNIWRHWGGWALDLSALYFSAWFAGAGETGLIHAPEPAFAWVDAPTEWRDLAAAQGSAGEILMPYVYPPLWAYAFAPLAQAVTAQAFFNGAVVINVLALAASVLLARTILAPRRWSLAFSAAYGVAVLELTQIGQMALTLGQPQIVVSLLVLAAFAALAARHELTAGALLALAASVKLFPALLVLVFVMERRWRALAAFLAVGAALACASLAVAGWELHAALLERMADLDGKVLVSRLNNAFELVLFQLGEAVRGTADWAIPEPRFAPEPAWVGVVVKVMLVAGMWRIWTATGAMAGAERLWSRVMGVHLMALLASPVTWPHYMIVPLMLLPGLLVARPGRGAELAVMAFLAAFFAPLFLWLAPYPSLGFAHVFLADGAMILLLWKLVGRHPVG